MKKAIASIFLWGMIFYASAQKEGNQWPTGTFITLMDFNSGVVQVSEIDTPLVYGGFGGSGSVICDSTGQMRLFTNGATLYRNNYSVILNGDTIIPDALYNYSGAYSPNVAQESIILPGGPDDYCLFISSMSDSIFNQVPYFDLLLYSTIDMSADSGRGAVIRKREVLLQDSFSVSRLTAVRHANGRDFWLVKSYFQQHKYFVYLISKDSIIGPIVQSFPGTIEFNFTVYGQIAFNSSGTQMANVTSASHIALMDFDRCTGIFTYNRSITIHAMSDSIYPDLGAYGISFSPNGRFIYANQFDSVWQIDLQQNDEVISLPFTPSASAGCTSFPGFELEYLGPDGKNYIDNFNGVCGGQWGGGTSYIANPNEKYPVGYFCYQCLIMPNEDANGMPNHPDFRLLSIDGSPCDTLGIDMPPSSISEESHIKRTVNTYPNPNQGIFVIEVEGIDWSGFPLDLEIMDTWGRVVHTGKLQGYLNAIELPEIKDGIYFYIIRQKGKTFGQGKIVIVKN